MGKNRPVRKKIVVIGDGASGKTCMLISFVSGDFRDHYAPTIFENTIAEVELESQHIELALWDTAGQEEYDRLRTLTYPDSNVILICFAVDNPDSLENVQDKWLPEVGHYCRGVPFMLIATKLDLRADHDPAPNGSTVSQEEGLQAANWLGASRYMECSAKTGEGIHGVFEEATRIALRNNGKRRHQCVIL